MEQSQETKTVEQIYLIDSCFATAGLVVKNGYVVKCAPIFRRWFLTEPFHNVVSIVEQKGWSIQEVRIE
jgi:hypothetical protein